MKGPKVLNADDLTQRTESQRSVTNIGAKTVLRRWRVQAHETDMMTSAQAFLTPGTSSWHKSTNLES